MRSDLRRLRLQRRPTFNSAAVGGGGGVIGSAAPVLEAEELFQTGPGLTVSWEIRRFPDLLDLLQQEAPKLQNLPALERFHS